MFLDVHDSLNYKSQSTSMRAKVQDQVSRRILRLEMI